MANKYQMLKMPHNYSDLSEPLQCNRLVRDLKEMVAKVNALLGDADSQPKVGGDSQWPIGSIFFCVTSDDPGVLLGLGTWERIAKGQFPVGFKDGDAEFGALGAMGGSKTFSGTISGCSVDAHTTTEAALSGTGSTILTGPVTHTVTQPTMSGGSTLPPYFVVNIWKRVK